MLSDRRICVLNAFDEVLRHQCSPAVSRFFVTRGPSSESEKCICPELLLLAARILTLPPIRVSAAEAKDDDVTLKAQIGAEFLLSDDEVALGVTRDAAVHAFERLQRTPRITLSQWEYFFGVEEATGGSSSPSTTTVPGAGAKEVILARASPLRSNATSSLRAALKAREWLLAALDRVNQNEESDRRQLAESEVSEREELISTFRRLFYAMQLRRRLEEDRALLTAQDLVDATDQATAKDAEELRVLRWEQTAVQRSIEASRSANAKVEYALQETVAAVEACGQQLPGLRQWKDVLLQLAVAEVRDSHRAMLEYVQGLRARSGSLLSSCEDRIGEVGRTLMLMSVTRNGRERHLRDLDAVAVSAAKRNEPVNHSSAPAGDRGDFSWLLLDGDQSAGQQPQQPAVYGDDDDDGDDAESLARYMVRDVELFVAPSSFAGRTSRSEPRVMNVSQKHLILQSFQLLLLRSTAEKENPGGNRSADFTAEMKPLPARGDVLQGTIDVHTFSQFVRELPPSAQRHVPSIPLEFEQFCRSGAAAGGMGVEGYLRFLLRLSKLRYSRLARHLSAPLLLDLFCARILTPWLSQQQNGAFKHLDSSRAGYKTQSLLTVGESVGSRVATVQGEQSWALPSLLEELLGAMLVEGLLPDAFVDAFEKNVSQYVGGAPLPSQGSGGDGDVTHWLSPFAVVGLWPADRVGLHTIVCEHWPTTVDTNVRLPVDVWAAALQRAEMQGFRLLGSLDACASWLTCSASPRDRTDGGELTRSAIGFPSRHTLVPLLADAIVRIAQRSLQSKATGSFRFLGRTAVSRRIFSAVVPSVLDFAELSESKIATEVAQIPSWALENLERAPIAFPMFAAALVVLSQRYPREFSLGELLPNLLRPQDQY